LDTSKERTVVVIKFIEGNDAFVSSPTSGDKSLYFACLPLVYNYLRGVIDESIAITVSPFKQADARPSYLSSPTME